MAEKSCGPKQLANVLKKICFDPENAGSFGGIKPLLSQARKSSSCTISKDFVKKWLSNVPAYSLHKPAFKHFPRLRYIVSKPFEQFQADLMDLGSLIKFNDGYRYLLVVIDIFTRKAWSSVM